MKTPLQSSTVEFHTERTNMQLTMGKKNFLTLDLELFLTGQKRISALLKACQTAN